MKTKFKSKGMQRATFYYVGLKRKDYVPMYSQIGYWTPEERIKEERIEEELEVLHDSENYLVVLTSSQIIVQFENN